MGDNSEAPIPSKILLAPLPPNIINGNLLNAKYNRRENFTCQQHGLAIYKKWQRPNYQKTIIMLKFS